MLCLKIKNCSWVAKLTMPLKESMNNVKIISFLFLDSTMSLIRKINFAASRLPTIIMKHYHIKNLHFGTQTLLHLVRQEYWSIKWRKQCINSLNVLK